MSSAVSDGRVDVRNVACGFVRSPQRYQCLPIQHLICGVGKTQLDYENDYNDPVHWYNGNNFSSKWAAGEIKRDLPSDAATILDYIKKLSNDEMKVTTATHLCGVYFQLEWPF